MSKLRHSPDKWLCQGQLMPINYWHLHNQLSLLPCFFPPSCAITTLCSLLFFRLILYIHLSLCLRIPFLHPPLQSTCRAILFKFPPQISPLQESLPWVLLGRTTLLPCWHNSLCVLIICRHISLGKLNLNSTTLGAYLWYLALWPHVLQCPNKRVASP